MSLINEDIEVRKIPDYVLKGLTTRQWKSKKRQEIKSVIKALNEFAFGSAYCAGYEVLGDIRKNIERMKKEMSVKNWK